MNLPWMDHCGNCGTKFEDQGTERACAHCGETTWAQNQTAVAVTVPVWDGPEKIAGYIVTRRGIPPRAGELCLVSGFQDYLEDPAVSAVREFQEEVLGEWEAQEYMLDPKKIKITGVKLGAGGKINIITARHEGISIAQWEKIQASFKPNSEVTEIFLVTEAIELAFDIQTNHLRDTIFDNINYNY